ncbi:MAG: glycerophosphodiester phosphodiesterase [Promethearchaeota archaeon]
MKKPYIFGHRGAMGYEIENTIPSFKKAIKIGAGIETDLHLTKDNILICFHDSAFKIDNKVYYINKLTIQELKSIKFNDKRKIPTLQEVFNLFYEYKNLRYSCDIGNKKVGLELIKLIEKYTLFKKVEITDLKPRILFALRNASKKIQLVHTIPYSIIKVNNKTINFEKLKENNIKALNLKYDRANYDNFKNIIDNGFQCYVWGVNTKSRMKKVIELRYNDECVSAIYTNYPDILSEFIKKKYT